MAMSQLSFLLQVVSPVVALGLLALCLYWLARKRRSPLLLAACASFVLAAIAGLLLAIAPIQLTLGPEALGQVDRGMIGAHLRAIAAPVFRLGLLIGSLLFWLASYRERLRDPRV